VNFYRLPNKLKFLHYFELRVHFYYDSSGADSEVANVAFIFDRLDAEESCSYCVSWRPENSEAKTKLRCILYHSHVYLAIARFVFHCENWYRLKLSPSYAKCDWILCF